MAVDTPLTIRLELARAEDAGDPHAFRTGPQEYLVRWEGGAFEAARLTWDDALLQDLAAVRLPGRDPELVRSVGARLQRFLEPTRFRERAGEIQAAAHAGRRIQLDIVAAAAELYALPWELFALPDGRHLGEVPGLLIQYQWPGTTVVRPHREPRPEGGRILFAWSRAHGNVGEALALDAVAAAARAGFVDFDRDKDVLPDTSLPALVAELERRCAAPDPPAVLHLLAHGAALGDAYGLGLDDGRGGREVVDSAALRRALAPFAPHLRLVVLMACDSGNPGPLGARLGSAVQELHRAGFEAVVGSRFPLAGAAALEFTRALYTDMLERTCSIEQAFAGARARLARGAGLDWASVMLYGHGRPGRECRPIVFRPHRGLLAFEREHARFFFGRDDERREAIADLEKLIAARKSRLLVVAGASGTGKSSVVLAGIVPDVEALGWTAVVLRPGRTPQRNLDDALARRPADGRPFLLVVDQFEEIFTHADDSDADPSAFARRLWDLSRSTDSHTRVILTLRVDYLGRCGEVVLDDAGLRLDRVAYDEDHRVFIAHMGPDKLAQTIEGPVGRVGLSLEPGLSRRLLDEIGGDPVGLPLLQYALDELWKRRQDGALTHAALDTIGGVVGALTRHAEAIWAGLSEAERLQARRLLVRIVAYGGDPSTGTRRRELEEDLRQGRDPDSFDRAARALIDARLLVRRVEPDGRATLEVAHEALIRHWDRLWRWYEEDRVNLARHHQLSQMTAQAEQHGELLAGNLLAAAEALTLALGDDADPDARAFVRRSRAAADRSHRLARLARLAFIASLAVGLAVFAFLRSQAVEEAARAEQATRRARDGASLAVAYTQMYERPHVAAALLRDSRSTELRQWRQAAFIATQALLPSAVTRLVFSRHLPSLVTALALTPDGAAAITGHDDGALRLWPLSPGTSEAVVLAPPASGPNRAIHEIVVAPDGDGVAVIAGGGHLRHRFRLRGADIARVGGPTADDPGTRVHLARSGRIAEFDVRASVTIRDPAGELLAARRDCVWVDPAGERTLCRGDDGYDLSSWTSDAAQRRLVREPLDERPLSPAAVLSAVPGLDGAGEQLVVDLPGGRVYELPPGRAALGRDVLVQARCYNAAGPGAAQMCEVCSRPRAGERPPACASLPRDCLAARLHDLHPDLGALVECGGPQPRLLLVEPDGGRDVAVVRHHVALPEGEARALRLAGDLLHVVTSDAELWRWDLSAPPSGLIPVQAHGSSALVDGTASLIDAQLVAGAPELRRLTWARLGAAPAVERLPLPAALAGLRPCCVAADPDGFVAAFAPALDIDRPDAPQPDGALVFGDLPLARSRVVRRPLDVAANLLAKARGRPAVALPAGDTIDVLDLAAPDVQIQLTAPKTPAQPPLDAPEPLVAAAFHPEGHGLALAWAGGSAVVGDRRLGVVRALVPRDPLPCGETDPSARRVTALAYAPDGNWLAVGHASGRLDLLPLGPLGQHVPSASDPSLCHHPVAITALAFTSDGRTVLSGDERGGLALWSGIDRPPDDLAREPIFLWLPDNPPIADLTATADHVLALTRNGDLWYTHATFDAAGLQQRLVDRARACLEPIHRTMLLAEDPETATAAYLACPFRHVLTERDLP